MRCWYSARTLASRWVGKTVTELASLAVSPSLVSNTRFPTVRSTLLVSLSRSFVLRPLLTELCSRCWWYQQGLLRVAGIRAFITELASLAAYLVRFEYSLPDCSFDASRFSRSFVLRPLLAELSEVLVFSKDSCESLGRQDRHRAGFFGRLPSALRLLASSTVRSTLLVSLSIVRSMGHF